MLELYANLIFRPTTMRAPLCQVEAVIELPQDEFIALSHRPNAEYGFITENQEMTGEWDEAFHCLLALDKGSGDGMLIISEEYGYVRMGAYVSHARDFLMRELERIADMFLKEISPDEETGNVCIYLEDLEEYTGAAVREDGVIACMFGQILQQHPGVSGVAFDGGCMTLTPALPKIQGKAQACPANVRGKEGGLPELRADLIHKPAAFTAPVCQVEKIIELPQSEFAALTRCPNADYGFIAENRSLMGERDGVFHCLLALDAGGRDGVLINSEGYDSVRYGAFVSHARDIAEQVLSQTLTDFDWTAPSRSHDRAMNMPGM